jgi:hypothetical protein
MALIEVNAPLPVPGYTNHIEPRTQTDPRHVKPSITPAESPDITALGRPSWQIKIFVVRGVGTSTLRPTTHSPVPSDPDLGSANPGSRHPPALPSEQS